MKPSFYYKLKHDMKQVKYDAKKRQQQQIYIEVSTDLTGI